jgi:chemotaxis protein methyltransferase CheR
MAFYSESLDLPDNAFHILRNLIMEKTGIYYEENKRDLLADKLSNRVIELGFSSFIDYYYLLKYDKGSAEEWEKVIDLITVKETYFWREPDQIQTFIDHVIPEYLNRNTGKPFRIWCAACSTGEEPLSILIALDNAGLLKKMKIEMLASDLSQQAIKKAKDGLYSERSFRNLPTELRDRYFVKKANQLKINEYIHELVLWKIINLQNESELSMVPLQNTIFCRNVFIYFRDDSIKNILDNMFIRLHSPGYLFVGVTESLFRIPNRFELMEAGNSFVYRKT